MQLNSTSIRAHRIFPTAADSFKGGWSAGETYEYDPNGNRTGDGQVIGSQHRLLSDAAFEYRYDGIGRLVERTAADNSFSDNFAYDHRGRLLSVTRTGSESFTIEYAYDPNGNLVARTVDGVTTFIVTDGLDRELHLNESGESVRHTLFGSRANEVLAVDTEGVTAWAFADHLGSVPTWSVYDDLSDVWRLSHTASTSSATCWKRRVTRVSRRVCL